MAAQVQDRHEIAVSEAAADRRFPTHACAGLGVVSIADLDRHQAFLGGVVSLVHDGEGAATDTVEDLVLSQVTRG